MQALVVLLPGDDGRAAPGLLGSLYPVRSSFPAPASEHRWGEQPRCPGSVCTQRPLTLCWVRNCRFQPRPSLDHVGQLPLQPTSGRASFTSTFYYYFQCCQIHCSSCVHPAGRAMLLTGAETSLCVTRNGGGWCGALLWVFFQCSGALPAGIWFKFWEQRCRARSQQLFQWTEPAGSTCSPAAWAFRHPAELQKATRAGARYF